MNYTSEHYDEAIRAGRQRLDELTRLIPAPRPRQPRIKRPPVLTEDERQGIRDRVNARADARRRYFRDWKRNQRIYLLRGGQAHLARAEGLL